MSIIFFFFKVFTQTYGSASSVEILLLFLLSLQYTWLMLALLLIKTFRIIFATLLPLNKITSLPSHFSFKIGQEKKLTLLFVKVSFTAEANRYIIEYAIEFRQSVYCNFTTEHSKSRKSWPRISLDQSQVYAYSNDWPVVLKTVYVKYVFLPDQILIFS